MPLGPNDLKNISLPTAWDSAELNRLRLRDGATYAEVIRDINDALALVNASLQGGYYSQLVSLTTEPTVEYRTGVSNGFEDHTEYGVPDDKRADTSGHMLPLSKQDRKLGWTVDFLEECRRTQIDADVADMAQDAVNAYEKGVLTRHFKMEEETGKRYGLGSAGYSVPFADASAGTIPFTPVAVPNRGGTFLSTHDHYLRLNGITQANLETAVYHLWEHGVDGPYELMISLADLAAWQTVANVTGYVDKADALIQYGSTTSLARVGEEYVGGVKTKYGFCRMVAIGRIPTGYWSVTKAYGPLDQRNPLKVRWDDRFGWGVKLVTEDVSRYPLKGAVGIMKFGVGVGESRVGAVLVLNAANGDYITPTIS